MREAFLSGGIMMWPMLVVAIGILVLAARTTWLLGRAESQPSEVERRLQSIVFWGVMSVILGILGTTVGIIQMAQAVSLAGAVDPPLVWGGFGVALVTLIFGLLIFVVSALSWFVLRQWYTSVSARDRRSLPSL